MVGIFSLFPVFFHRHKLYANWRICSFILMHIILEIEGRSKSMQYFKALDP